MKSRVVTKLSRIVLTYGIVDSTLTMLSDICKDYSISVRPVMPSELDVKVSNLLKITQLNIEEYPIGTTPCMVISGLDSSIMDSFLDNIKSVGINIPIKAMVTPSNQNWNFRHLLEEISLEHERLSKK